jgi:hypothetical protein
MLVMLDGLADLVPAFLTLSAAMIFAAMLCAGSRAH